MIAVVETIRELLFHMLDGAPVVVHRWLPVSADELPAIVIGRPEVATDSDSAALAAVTVDVFALGRTSRDPDAQQELDRLGDLLLSRFWSPPPAEGVHVRLDELAAGTVDVAGVTIPAYTATVSARFANC